MFRDAQRTVLLACAGAVTLAAWLWLAGGSPVNLMPVHHHRQMDPRGFVSLVAMWQCMMVAMMTPAVIDWLLTFAKLAGGARPDRWPHLPRGTSWFGWGIAFSRLLCRRRSNTPASSK